MAAQSPVVLDSSSPPPAFRHPSMTPQKGSEVASSSPGLPEVSSFFRTNINVPAVGSRIAHAVPAARSATALPGFTSAGTLWKAAAFEAERKEQVGKSIVSETTNKARLARPVKKAQAEEEAAAGSRARTRTPSISLSEFDFREEEHPDQMLPPQLPKKAGKRDVRPKEGGHITTVKQARGKAKESVDALPKASKRASKPKVQASDDMSEHQQASHASIHVAQAAPMSASAAPEITRRPSLSLSESEYDVNKFTPAREVQQTSTYFPPSNHAAPSPKPAAALVAETAIGHDAGSLPPAAKSPRHFEHPTITGDAPVHNESLPVNTVRKASISLSESGYNPDAHRPSVELPPAKAEPAKKPRKRTTKPRDPLQDGSAKKPKKRFAKSASIILNSDEPDAAAEDQALLEAAHIDRGASVEQIQAAVYAPKNTKAPKKSKASKAARTKTAEPDVPEGPGFAMWRQSVYFNQALVADSIENGATAEALQNVFAVNEDVENARAPQGQCHERTGPPPSPRPQTSFSRRRSWTPAKNTYEVLDPEVDSSGESPAQRKSLADLVGAFGYDEQANPQARSLAGEPLTKKRRIDPENDLPAVPAVRKAAAVKEKVKKPKAPKKKPQTITDLATKAYRVEEAEGPNTPNAQSTVSEFFTAQKDGHNATAASASAEPGEAVPTFKKPRKPRVKKVDGETPTAKKTPKTKKAKVKFNEMTYLPPLLSPQQARAVEKTQGFLFGTSSQLALEEDVSFVRDLQAAIQESEAAEVPSISPKRLSTNVSVGRAERRLFWSASRDSRGYVIAANGVRRKSVTGMPPHAAVAKKHTTPPKDETTPSCCSAVLDAAGSRKDKLQDGHGGGDLPGVSQVVDLCGTSPTAAADQEKAGTVEDAELSLPAEPSTVEEEPLLPAPTAAAVDDSWMLLETDSSDIDEAFADDLPPPPACSIPAVSKLTVTNTSRPATSPIRGQPRTALTTLDSNIAILAQTSPAKQKRTFVSQASPDPPKRPRGRPPKVASTTSAAALSPKRKGRSPKALSPRKSSLNDESTLSASQPPRSSDFVAIDDISDSDSEDVPLKDVVAANPAPASPKRRGRPAETSQQSPVASPPKSSFVKLDDISDSDAGKQTPSPRRRKAGPTSPIQTLELSPSALADTELPPIVDGKAAMKPTDPCWIPVSKVLFRHITAVVRSTPPCGESGELSWWEKILMYDPIVLEDLTAWLVGRGVSVSVRRKIVKEKKKGRKKKGDADEEVVQVEEYEVVKEELKGWMVQKWCEEKSICCLWKEGLRGGVKVRY